MEPTSVYLDGETLELLDEFMKKQRVEVSRSAVLRAAVYEFCNKGEK